MAEIQLEPGTLPGYPPCYSSEQERFDAYVAAIIAEIIGGIQWQATETAPTDTDLWWQKMDGPRIVEYLKWSTADGAWIRPFSEVINTGTAAGAGNAYTITNAPPMTAATAYRSGTTFTFRANHANTGSVTLSIDGLPPKELRKLGGTAQLLADEIVAGQMIVAIYDGTYFQIASVLPRVGLATRLDYVYDYNTPTASLPATVDFSLTRPVGTVWQEFELFASVAAATDSGYQITCNFTFQSSPIAGNNVNTESGIGNSGQQWQGSVDNDSVLAQWRWTGKVPTSLLNETTLYFRATFTTASSGTVSSTHTGARGTYLTREPIA